jgi:hypothetical protein
MMDISYLERHLFSMHHDQLHEFKPDLSSCKDLWKGTILYESRVFGSEIQFLQTLCLLLTGYLQDQAKYDVCSCFNSSFSSK